jgi:hypothetical protein
MRFWQSTGSEVILDDSWKENAPTIFGIPLHPDGESNVLDYFIGLNTLEEIQLHSGSFYIQTMMSAFFNYAFTYNIIRIVNILYHSPRSLAGWCCFIQSGVGLVYTLLSLISASFGGMSCRRLVWFATVGIAISAVCVGTALLERAYLAHSRNRWLLIGGILLILPQVTVIYYGWTSPSLIVFGVDCIVIYPPRVPWIKVALDAPINILFSIAFISVVYRQYRIRGSKAWKHLLRNGIQTMCIIVISNLVCMFGAAIYAFNNFSEFFFVLDWVITSLLLVHHCKQVQNMGAKRTSTQTPVKAVNLRPTNTSMDTSLLMQNTSISDTHFTSRITRQNMIQ